MKKVFLLLALLLITSASFSQGGRPHLHPNGVRFLDKPLPSSPIESWMKYDFTNNEFIYYNGTAWVPVGGSGGTSLVTTEYYQEGNPPDVDAFTKASEASGRGNGMLYQDFNLERLYYYTVGSSDFREIMVIGDELYQSIKESTVSGVPGFSTTVIGDTDNQYTGVNITVDTDAETIALNSEVLVGGILKTSSSGIRFSDNLGDINSIQTTAGRLTLSSSASDVHITADAGLTVDNGIFTTAETINTSGDGVLRLGNTGLNNIGFDNFAGGFFTVNTEGRYFVTSQSGTGTQRQFIMDANGIGFSSQAGASNKIFFRNTGSTNQHVVEFDKSGTAAMLSDTGQGGLMGYSESGDVNLGTLIAIIGDGQDAGNSTRLTINDDQERITTNGDLFIGDGWNLVIEDLSNAFNSTTTTNLSPLTANRIIKVADVSGVPLILSDITTAPTSSTDLGRKGELRIVGAFRYECISNNVWVRTSVTTSF